MLASQVCFIISIDHQCNCSSSVQRSKRNMFGHFVHILSKKYISQIANLSGGGDESSLPVCSFSCMYNTYNCLLILIYYRLGQNQLIINKYADTFSVQLMAYTISKGLAYIITHIHHQGEIQYFLVHHNLVVIYIRDRNHYT